MSQTLNLGGEPQSPQSLPLPGLPLPRVLVALVSVRLPTRRHLLWLLLGPMLSCSARSALSRSSSRCRLMPREVSTYPKPDPCANPHPDWADPRALRL